MSFVLAVNLTTIPLSSGLEYIRFIDWTVSEFRCKNSSYICVYRRRNC